jgi:WD40 repeat protein
MRLSRRELLSGTGGAPGAAALSTESRALAGIGRAKPWWRPMIAVTFGLPTLFGASPATTSRAWGQVAVSANDNKVYLDDGVVKIVRAPPPDTLTLIDLRSSHPSVIAEIAVPASVVGPPLSVAIAPDDSIALVTASMKVDPADSTRQIPDNRLSVIDLQVRPPSLIAQLECGKSPAGVSINRQGTLALVANRGDGTVSVLRIQGKKVTPIDKVTLGDEKAGVSHVAIAPDGKLALATRDGDHLISVLSIAGEKVEYAKRDMSAGLKPYGIDISPTGAFAVVANAGRGNGDSDTVSVIDLAATPPRVVDTTTVGQSPEGIILSPDGRFCAVVVIDGSNKAKLSPFRGPKGGKLVLLEIHGKRLTPVATAPIGHWSQGVAFSPDGHTILVQNMVEKEISVFSWDGRHLHDTGRPIKTNGGPAGLRASFKR